MTARIVDGRAVADTVLQGLRRRIDALRPAGAPHLAFVSIGDSPPAQVYMRRLERQGAAVGAAVSRHELPAMPSLAALQETLCRLNGDDGVDGILVQMPLPDHLTHADLTPFISPRKDVDGITTANVGHLYLGLPGQVPPTALAMMEILKAIEVSPTGKHAVVVGRSNIVGHPITELLLQQDATVTVTHRQTQDLGFHTRQADILMVGAGEPHLIRGSMVKPGAVVVDAGINVVEGGIVGDVAFDECAEIAAAITPVPGGVGPVTNSMLMRNLVASAARRGG